MEGKRGTFYGIGVGPGDPELITLKAVRQIGSCQVLMVPGVNYQDSIAWQIACRAVPETEQIPCVGVEIPMVRDPARRQAAHEAAAALAARFLEQGKNVGFLNLGDVTLYASCLYVYRLVKEKGFDARLINGVPSFCAAAAALGTGLAEDSQQLHILSQPGQLDEGLRLPGTKVMMKLGKHFPAVKRRLLKTGTQALMAENCGLPGERLAQSLEEMGDEAGYYSLLVVKDQEKSREARQTPKPVLFAVGMGPGKPEQMTVEARRTLESCQVIVGYTVYVELLKQWLPEKEYLSTPMRQETKRCRMAFEEAKKGRRTAMVCSGDAGVYGMSGLLLEIGQEYPEVSVKVIPGVTAALSGAAVLGAPLMHDFAVISLSDLMTPWETIEGRLRSAAQGDFVICLYNPSSKRRADYLRRACRVLLETEEEERVCGLVSQIGREGESWEILTLGQLKDRQTDMFTTVFIGNSQTRAVGGRMVTPRGYQTARE